MDKHWRDLSVTIDIHTGCDCCSAKDISWYEFLQHFTDDDRLPDAGEPMPITVALRQGEQPVDDVLDVLVGRGAAARDGSVYRTTGFLVHRSRTEN